MATVDVGEVESVAEDPLLVGDGSLAFVDALHPVSDQSTRPHQTRHIGVQLRVLDDRPVEVEDALDDSRGNSRVVEQAYEVFLVR